MTKAPSWSGLMDGYGPATTTPDLLADLCSQSAADRTRARQQLHDRYVTDEPVSGLPEVVKALVLLAFDKRTIEVNANIRLLVDLVMVDPDAYLREPFAGAQAVKKMSVLERAAYDAFLALGPLGEALADPDPKLRAIACLALSFVVEPEAHLLMELERLATSDSVKDVRTSALLALARIGRHGSPESRTAVSRVIARAEGANGAIATFLIGEALSEAALTALAAALPMPPRARDDLPWANGDLADVASAILRAQGERAMAVAPLVVDAVEKQSRRRVREALANRRRRSREAKAEAALNQRSSSALQMDDPPNLYGYRVSLFSKHLMSGWVTFTSKDVRCQISGRPVPLLPTGQHFRTEIGIS